VFGPGCGPDAGRNGAGEDVDEDGQAGEVTPQDDIGDVTPLAIIKADGYIIRLQVSLCDVSKIQQVKEEQRAVDSLETCSNPDARLGHWKDATADEEDALP
jgi:hypothetical protein